MENRLESISLILKAHVILSQRQNVGLDDLVEHHVEPEKDALAFLDIDYNNIDVHIEGDFA